MPNNTIEKKKLVGITSPPYEEQTLGKIGNKDKNLKKGWQIRGGINFMDAEYGNSQGQIGLLKSKGTEESFDITQFHSCGDSLYWHGCYSDDKRFNQYVTPESFAHPAKGAWGLYDRIFKHIKHLELLQKGDVVCDFMAGSGRTGILSSLHGHDFVGIELEPHFIKMINDNKTRLENKIGRKVNWQVIQGDSRKLSEILQQKGLVGITSPPYQNIEIGKGLNILPPREGKKDQSKRNSESPSQKETKYSSNPHNIGNLKDGTLVGITSPPYSEAKDGGGIFQRGYGDGSDKIGERTYSKTTQIKSENNIANLPDKNLVGITSPPYDNRLSDNDKREFMDKEGKHKRPSTAYGSSKEQIGNLVGVTSPPYEDSESAKSVYPPEKWQHDQGRKLFNEKGEPQHYGTSNGQLGSEQGESYLSAMLQVYQEAAKVMPIIVTVTKNPTRNGKLRRLDLDTAKLLEMTGYKIVDYHRAVLFEERKQATLKGGIKKQVDGRLSFFKRLSVQKGNIAARWEDIIIGIR